MRQFLLAIVLACSASPSAFASDDANLTLKDLSGNVRNLTEYRGRIVVLNFWATWCAPCVKEMPILVSAYNRYAANGVQVIGASADDPKTQKQIPRFISKLKINFPVWTGATKAHMQMLGLGEALPATAIIDRDGKIVARIQGILDEAELEKRIDWLLGDRQLPAPPALVTSGEKPDHNHNHGEANTDPSEHERTQGEPTHQAHDHKHEGEEHAHHHGHGSENHQQGLISFDGASSVPS